MLKSEYKDLNNAGKLIDRISSILVENTSKDEFEAILKQLSADEDLNEYMYKMIVAGIKYEWQKKYDQMPYVDRKFGKGVSTVLSDYRWDLSQGDNYAITEAVLGPFVTEQIDIAGGCWACGGDFYSLEIHSMYSLEGFDKSDGMGEFNQFILCEKCAAKNPPDNDDGKSFIEWLKNIKQVGD